MEELTAVMNTFRATRPDDYPTCLKLVITKLQPELEVVNETHKWLGLDQPESGSGSPVRMLYLKLRFIANHFEECTVRLQGSQAR